MTDPLLAYTHPEFVRRWDMLVEECWKRGWSPSITSSTRSYAQQTLWYQRWIANGRPNGPVANPDQFWGWAPWGMLCYGSLHMIQSDGYSHALDVAWQGCTQAQFHDLAYQCGIRFPEMPAENWHAQFWGNNGIYPVFQQQEEPDMTPQQLGLIRNPDDPNDDRWGNMLVETFDPETNEATYKWYVFGDAVTFTHQELKMRRIIDEQQP